MMICNGRKVMAVLAAVTGSSLAFAQSPPSDFPTKPVSVVAPFTTGASEAEFRLFLHSILEHTGKRFIIDIKPGAGSTIGTAYVAKAAPDGYTLLIAGPAHTIAPSLYPDLPYDNIKDFAPITLLNKRAFFIAFNNSTPYSTIADYVAYAKANPGAINVGTSGLGSSTHLAAELLHYLSGIKVTYVHYKAPNQRLVDLMAGRVNATVVAFGSGFQQVKAGKMRAIAVTSNQRVPIAQELPTVEEQGVRGYDYSSWGGVLAPARTPSAIIDRLNAIFVQSTKDPDLVKKLEGDGSLMIGSTPQQFRQLLVTETERWRKVVKEAGIQGAD